MTSLPQAYQGIEGLQILCLVQTDVGLASDSLKSGLCNAVAEEAGKGTKIPVSVIVTGDPQVLAADRLTILVHASITGPDRVALAMRPYRPATAGSEVLFGAMPRVVSLADKTELAAAIAASLDEILPWRAAPGGARRLN